jgi:hypothetical protein
VSNLSNLPPGVSANDIPGNRPEDLWWDAFLGELTMGLISPTGSNANPEELANDVNLFLRILEGHRCEAFYEGYSEGVAEGYSEGVAESAQPPRRWF